jgi:hypothetical protein
MQIPNIDSDIEVTLHDPLASGMIPPRPAERSYRGRVIASHRWLTDREFCITGDDQWPVRVIDISRVKNLRIITGSSHTIQTQDRTWTVAGSRGNQYTVTRDRRGWTCTCPGFQFRKNCRHITDKATEVDNG